MQKSNVSTTELLFAEGQVAFGYEPIEESVEMEEPTLIAKFHNLSELVDTLSKEKLDYFAKTSGAKSIWVDSINFVTKSEDGTTQIETLMMEDQNFVEMMQR